MSAAAQLTVAAASPIAAALVAAATKAGVPHTTGDRFTVRLAAHPDHEFTGILPIVTALAAASAGTPAAAPFSGASASQRAAIAQWSGLAAAIAAETATAADAEAVMTAGGAADARPKKGDKPAAEDAAPAPAAGPFVAGTAAATVADALLLAATAPAAVAAPSKFPKLARWARAAAAADADGLLGPLLADAEAKAAGGVAVDKKGAAEGAAAGGKASGGKGGEAAKGKPVYVKPTAEEIEARRKAKEADKAAKAAAKAAEDAKKEAGAAAPAADAAPKKKGGKGNAPAAPVGPSNLDLRFGRIVGIEKHPSADRLFVEKIDLGEAAGPRTIVSGLVQHYEAAQLDGRWVMCICNLKPRPLQGIESHGMVMCASADGQGLRVVEAPAEVVAAEGLAPGARISIGGEMAPEPPAFHKKVLDVLGGLRTDEQGAVVWGDDAMPLAVGGVALKSAVTGALVK